jgi:hypothetical protein
MWNRKHCAICRLSFAVHPNAKTAHTRTLCIPCRKAMVKAKRRRQVIQSQEKDIYGRWNRYEYGME